MAKKKPNNWFAPIVIAGLTVGLLASAYKFIFANEKLEIEKDLSQKGENKGQEK